MIRGMTSRSSFRHRLFGVLLVGALALGAPATVSAQTEPADTSAVDHDEISELVALVLAELGLPTDDAGPLVERVLGGVTKRINTLVDEGIVDPEQVDSLTTVIEDGGFDDVAEVVEHARERRTAFRNAAQDALAELGIEVPERGSLNDAIEEAGLTREGLRTILEESGVELPDPPARPERRDPERNADDCEGDTCPAPSPRQDRERTDGEPRQAPERTPATTTTQAPVADEPAPQPAEPVEAGYPEVAPQPAPAPQPEYPARGGERARPERPTPRGDYPSTGAEQPAEQPEEAL